MPLTADDIIARAASKYGVPLDRYDPIILITLMNDEILSGQTAAITAALEEKIVFFSTVAAGYVGRMNEILERAASDGHEGISHRVGQAVWQIIDKNTVEAGRNFAAAIEEYTGRLVAEAKQHREYAELAAERAAKSERWSLTIAIGSLVFAITALAVAIFR